MSYRATSYFYIFCSNEVEKQNRINKLLDFLIKHLDARKVKCLQEDMMITKTNNQLIFNNSSGENYINFSDVRYLGCVYVDYEADIKNTEKENYDYALYLTTILLKNNIIDVAGVYSPNDKGRLFEYYGTRFALLLFFIQRANRYKSIMKYIGAYEELIEKFIKNDTNKEIVFCKSNQTKYFVSKNNNDSVSEFLNKTMLKI